MHAATLQDLAVQALNVSLMLSVGLELDLAEVRRAGRRVPLLAAVTLLNFGLLPLAALAATGTVALAPAVAAGLLLASLAPGGGTGTLLTRAAGGNLELSVVLLGIFTALAVPLVPALAVATLPAEADGALSLGAVLQTLLLFQLLPLAAGLGLRGAAPAAAARLDRLARPFSNAVFALLVLGLIVTRGHLVAQVGPAGLLVCVGLVLLSLLAPALLPASPRDRAALCMTTGVRNLSLALLVSSSFFGDLTTITVLTYGLAMYLLAAPAAWALRRRLAPRPVGE